MTETIENVVIIGSGPAGLTAAIYAARANLKPLMLTGLQHGGQLTTTTEVENFPGFATGIMGPELMQNMTAQAERVGTRIMYDEVTKVDFSGKPLKIFLGDKVVLTKTVVLSTGASAKTLGLPNEWDLMGRGVSTCATCDGFFYKNKKVVVVGGGDSAMEEANYLSKIAAEVILIHRRAEFKASKIMLDRAKANPKIKFMVPYGLEKLVGGPQGLEAIEVINLDSKEKSTIKLDGLFMAIGHTPNSKTFLPYVDVDDHGYIKTKHFTATKTPGVYAAGDIADPVFKQAITAAGMGCQAAMQAARYLEEMEGH